MTFSNIPPHKLAINNDHFKMFFTQGKYGPISFYTELPFLMQQTCLNRYPISRHHAQTQTGTYLRSTPAT